MAAIAKFFILLSLSSLFLSKAQLSGFSIYLIHRDSPHSPLYNAKQTQTERWAAAFNGSYERANHLKHSINSAESAVSPSAAVLNNHGSYLMKLSFGTPPVEINAAIDSGSDFIWTQCQPCSQCHPVKDPVFDPKASSSYRDITCNTRECKALGGSVCSENDRCKYRITYGDGSFSNGTFAFETITLDKADGARVSFTGMMFGCAENEGGTYSMTMNGIIGLGMGTFSLVNQMGKVAAGTFSHCFVPFAYNGKPSRINFGDNGIVSGDGVFSTSLHKKLSMPHYFVNLVAISVNNARIDFPGFSPSTDGNMFVDSGTTLTLLPRDLYNKVEAAVVAAIPEARITPPQAFLTTALCYGSGDQVKVPKITMHFSGVDVTLAPENVFVKLPIGVDCFTFTGGDVDVGIYGNMAMINFLVGYNSLAQTLSFKALDCTF